MKRNNRFFKFLRNAFLTLIHPIGFLLGISLLIATGAKYLTPAQADAIAVFGLFFPLLYSLSLLSLLVMAILRSKFGYVLLVILLFATPTLTRYVSFNAKAKEKEVKLLSYNVHGFKGFDKTKKHPDIQNKIIEFIAPQHFDLVCLQEFRSWSGSIPNDVAFLALNMGLKYTYFEGYWKRGGIQSDGFLILSNFPFVNKGVISSETRRNIGVYADILVAPDVLLRVASIHLVSFSLVQGEINLFSEGAMLEMETIKLHGKNIFGKLRNSFKVRATEIKDLKKFLSSDDIPMLICGDFNDTPASYIFEQMNKMSYIDSHLSAGNGFGATYAGKIPWLRIDYIFHSDDIYPGKSKVYKIPYSDHFPVSLSFGVKP